MTLFPKIKRPCPYLDRLDAVMTGDFCTMCKRDVHDLTDMNRRQRADFLSACGGDVCVRYTAMLRPALAAAAIAAGAMALPQPALAEKTKPRHAHVRRPGQSVRVPVILGGAPPLVSRPPQSPDTPQAADRMQQAETPAKWQEQR